MAVLTVDVGGSPITLACEKGGHAPPRKVGGRVYGFAGVETPSVRAELMVVPVVLAPLPTATVATIRDLFALGAQVDCEGDIFNNEGATIVCSGTITDELHEVGDRWTVNLTLYEIGSELPVNIPEVYLANLPDDDTGALKKAWTTVEGGFANTADRRVLNEISLDECGLLPDPNLDCDISYTNPATPEVTWLSTAFLADVTLLGRPVVRLVSKGGTADKFSTQATRAIIELVRAGVVINTITTGYSAGNGGFAGGTITMEAPGASVVAAEIGDRVRVKIEGRVGLHGGYADDNDGVSDLNRQTITYGYTGAGAYYSAITWSGLANGLDP
jgi:hypothetical protein